MNALIDHLWHTLLCAVLIAVFASLTRSHSAQVRLWLWRIFAAKLLVPFSVLSALGAWIGFPAQFAGDPPPAYVVELVGNLSPWFSASAWSDSLAIRVCVLIILTALVAAAARWSLSRIHIEAIRARVEELRLESDPDDRQPGVGFLRAALLTACALILVALPLTGGAVRASVHAHKVLEANTQNMTGARVTLRPARPGLGSRYFVKVNPRGVEIHNITVRELTGLAYGVSRFFVRGKHFREGGEEDWLVDSRYDVRIEAPVVEPENFDTYALRHVMTRELATTFGLEVYVNSECQKPCGKWADRVLMQVAPDSWALVDTKQPPPPEEKPPR